MKRSIAWLVATVLVLAPIAAAAAPGVASAGGSVSLSATINGHPVARASQSHAIRIDPSQPLAVHVDVTNGSSQPVEIRTVRIEGRAMGLRFFAFFASVALTVNSGATDSLDFLLDANSLRGQATGLMYGTVSILDAHRHVLAQQSLVSDARGSLASVFGLAGLVIAVLTGLAFLEVLIDLARNALPEGRMVRSSRFLLPGLGLGLLLGFLMSALRVWVPTPGHVIVVVLVSCAAMFGLGWLTPAPVRDSDDEDDESDDADLTGPGARETLRSS